jgi:hypothetical protein
MILGMQPFTFVHVAVSWIGIISGFIVVFGLIGGNGLDGLTVIFLASTVLTSVSGFGFPFFGFLPAHGVGVVSLVVLAVAIVARYVRHLAGGWRRTYVIGAVLALYFNVFVLVMQGFRKVAALHDLAPTQTEAPFKLAQLVVLLLFIALGALAVKGFRHS